MMSYTDVGEISVPYVSRSLQGYYAVWLVDGSEEGIASLQFYFTLKMEA